MQANSGRKKIRIARFGSFFSCSPLAPRGPFAPMSDTTDLPLADAAAAPQDENKLIAERREKLKTIREQAQAQGVAAFPNDFKPQHRARRPGRAVQRAGHRSAAGQPRHRRAWAAA